MGKIYVQCIRTLDRIRDQHVINFKYMSYLCHIQCIKSWIQAKSLSKYPNQIFHLVFNIQEVSSQIFYMEMEKFLSTWLDDTHSERKQLTKFHFLSVPIKQPKVQPKLCMKIFHVAHSKSTTKTLENKSLSLSLQQNPIFSISTLKLHKDQDYLLNFFYI